MLFTSKNFVFSNFTPENGGGGARGMGVGGGGMGDTSRGELLPVSTAPAIKILKVQQKCSKFRTPSVERLWQIPFFRLRLRASLVIGSLWLNPNSVTSCFELDIFTITWRATSLDKSFLRNIVGYHVRIITDIFVGLVLSPKISKNYFW